MQDDGPGRRAPGNALTKEQREAFWDTVVQSYPAAMDAARRRRIPEQDVRDVVHSGIVRLIEYYDRRRAAFPATPEHRCAHLMLAVSRYAIDCRRRGQRVTRPVHRHWGEEIVLPPRGRRVPDRPWHRVFGTVTAELARVGAAVEEAEGELDTLDSLVGIVQEATSRLHVDELRAVDVYIRLDKTRADAAEMLQLDLSDFNYLLRRAYADLRRILRQMIDSGEIPERSIWKGVIEARLSRYHARIRRKTERARRTRRKRADSGPESGDTKSPT